MTGQRKTQIAVSLVALIVAAIHVWRPALAVDGITLVLLLAAAVPWVLPLFKSLELPGGWKVEFQDLQNTERRAQNAGLLDESPAVVPEHEYSFQVVADEDPNLALAGLRIDI